MDERNRFLGSRRALSIASLVCIVLMLVSVNVIASRFFNVRLDLTAEHLYTLSPGTKHVLAAIDEPVTLRFYYSNKLGATIPSYGVYALRVREMLDQYVAAAHGKLRLEVYNPEPFSETEDRAVAFGLQGVPLDAQGEQVYFGLAGTNSTDDQQVIAFFQPDRERFLEYDLTRMIRTLAFPKKTVVGLMTTLPLQGDMMAMMQGRQSRPMAVMDQIQQLDDVEPIATTTTTIPADVDVLMLVQPQKLSEKTLFAIDQFVMKGGKALVFVDPDSELQASQATRGMPPSTAQSSDLPRLFKAWGLQMLPNVVAGDRRDARRVAVPVPGRGAQPMDYIAWLNLRAANLNRHDMISADLSQITMATAGILAPLKGATTNFEPLITTSRDSTKIPVDKVLGLPDVAGMLAGFKPDNAAYVLAAHVTGPAASAFPDGLPPSPAKPDASKPDAGKPAPAPAETKPTGLTRSVKPINVVVVADTDMLDDRFWASSQDFFGQRVVVPVANNADFVADAIEVLAGGDDLIGLRTRGTSARPFEVVDRIQRAADDRYSAEQQGLEQKLKATEAKLQNLTGRGQGTAQASLSPDQVKAIDQFRADMLKTREQLRRVQGALRGDIQRLKAILEFFDIALIPLLVAALAIVLGTLRLKRRSRRSVHV